MSGESTPERGANRYERPLDEALHLLANEGWANQSGGSLDGPVGWFAKISNDEAELAEIANAFGDDLEALGLTARDLQGYYLLTESPQDRFRVQCYPDAGLLDFAYESLADIHDRWVAAQ